MVMAIFMVWRSGGDGCSYGGVRVVVIITMMGRIDWFEVEAKCGRHVIMDTLIDELCVTFFTLFNALCMLLVSCICTCYTIMYPHFRLNPIILLCDVDSSYGGGGVVVMVIVLQLNHNSPHYHNYKNPCHNYKTSSTLPTLTTTTIRITLPNSHRVLIPIST